MALPRQQTRTVAGVTYTLTRRRVRNINLRVRADGSVAASAAPRVSVMKVDAFVASKADWVRSAQARVAARPRTGSRPAAGTAHQGRGPGPYPGAVPGILSPVRGHLPGRAYAQDRCAGYDHPLGQLQLKNRHVGFARRLCVAPLPAQEYVVVHEFCHFAHPNHGPGFWAAVAAVMPDYKARERLLKQM